MKENATCVRVEIPHTLPGFSQATRELSHQPPPDATTDLQFGDDLSSGSVTDVSGGGSKGRVADDGEESCIHLLGTGLSRQQRHQFGLLEECRYAVV